MMHCQLEALWAMNRNQAKPERPLDDELVRVLRDFGRLNELAVVDHRPAFHIVRVELLRYHHRVADRLFSGHHRGVDDLAQFVRAAGLVSIVPNATSVVERADGDETADCQSDDHKQTGQHNGDEDHVGHAVWEKQKENEDLVQQVRLCFEDTHF